MRGASYWDEIYQKGQYLDFWDYRYPSPELVTLVAAQLIPRGGVVLDVGCGSGNEALYLARCGYRVIGLDISEKALRIAKEKTADAKVAVDWRCGSALDIPVEDKSIDFVNDRGCCHHLREEDRFPYVKELSRILRPGARILLRGSKKSEFPFIAITQESIDKHFTQKEYLRGPLTEIVLVTNKGGMEANLVLLEKR